MSLNTSQAAVNASLASCIAHLQRSTAHLDSAITNLNAGVRDLPRTARVIQCIRVRIFSFLALLPAANAGAAL
jgi:hypothetical protein